MKKLSCIITAALLLSGNVFAAPSMAPSFESIDEIPEQEITENFEVETKAESPLPEYTYTVDSTSEEHTDETPSNHSDDDSQLMFEIYSGGDGSKEAPYEISTAQQLTYFSQSINSGNKVDYYYKLTADIDLNGANWTPVGFYTADTLYDCAFKGSFDGDGHTISNFCITSNDTRYIGFFGLMFNAEVKNLNLSGVTINVDRTGTNATAAYAAVLAGRVVSDDIGGKSTISNCHVTDSSVNLTCDKDVFASGLVAFALAGNYAEINLFNVSADADVTVVANATDWKGYSASKTPISYTGAGAGLLGYFGSLTNSTIYMRGAHSSGNVTVDSSSSGYVYAFGGGLIAQAATRITNETGGVAYFSSCHSDSNVTANGQLITFAGGFAGNLGATRNMFVFDCYASGDVTASSKYKYCAIGGFAGQIDFSGYSDSMGKPFSSNYASGNAIDSFMENGTSIESYVGGFAGYSFAPLFQSCYVLESQVVTGHEKFEDNGILTVTNNASTSKQGYPAFDFNTVWDINPQGEFPYPTLRKIRGVVLFYSEGTYFDEMYFGEDGKVSVPTSSPEKTDSKEWDYSFSYWSAEENGNPFDFENTVVNEDITLYAVFDEAKQKYQITFYSEGVQFGKAISVEYGNTVPVPDDIPEKEETHRYRYVFDYWSLSENGVEFDFDAYTVTQNDSFHAVFVEIDKTAWNGAIADSFGEGYGTANLPYIISTAEELALLEKVISEGDTDYTSAYYALGADINLGYNYWTPIGSEDFPFSAHLDGGGYSISCFKIANSNYMGLFGYIKSATIKNLYLSDFEIDIDNFTSTENVYAGGLAGYVHCYKTNTVIDSVYVNAALFDVKVSASTLYAGNIAGYVNSKAAKSLITNCYSTSDITASNNSSSGVTYVGGLTGYMYTYSSSLAKATNCYYNGTVVGYGTNKCSAGGLAGAVYSYGSAYSPSYPLGSLTNESADYDVMLDSCFADASVSSTSANSKSAAYASAVTGEISQYAGINNIFYCRGTTIISSGTVATYGISASAANLESKDFISTAVGFDFVNVWTYVGDGKYPVLRAMYSDKPLLRLNNVEFVDNTLRASVTAYAKSSNYTVIVSVYDERNRLIASKRTKLSSSEYANEFDISFDNLSFPYRVKVSAMDSLTFVPLFTAVEWFL